jgi:hypothetical protein
MTTLLCLLNINKVFITVLKHLFVRDAIHLLSSCKQLREIKKSHYLKFALDITSLELKNKRLSSVPIEVCSLIEELSINKVIIDCDFRRFPKLKKLKIVNVSSLESIDLPEVEELSIVSNKVGIVIDKFPKTTKSLTLFGVKRNSLHLPPGLEKLRINITETNISNLRNIENLKHIILEGLIDSERLREMLSQLPESVKILDLRGLCIMKTEQSNESAILLPPIVELNLSNDFDQNIVLPESLEVFHSGNMFSKKVTFPARLRKLKLGAKFLHPLRINSNISSVILPNLEELEMTTTEENFNILLPKLKTLKLVCKTVSKFRMTQYENLEDFSIFSKDIISISIPKFPKLIKFSIFCKLNEPIEIPETVEVLYVIDRRYVKIIKEPKVFKEIRCFSDD